MVWGLKQQVRTSQWDTSILSQDRRGAENSSQQLMEQDTGLNIVLKLPQETKGTERNKLLLGNGGRAILCLCLVWSQLFAVDKTEGEMS